MQCIPNMLRPFCKVASHPLQLCYIYQKEHFGSLFITLDIRIQFLKPKYYLYKAFSQSENLCGTVNNLPRVVVYACPSAQHSFLLFRCHSDGVLLRFLLNFCSLVSIFTILTYYTCKETSLLTLKMSCCYAVVSQLKVRHVTECDIPIGLLALRYLFAGINSPFRNSLLNYIKKT